MPTTSEPPYPPAPGTRASAGSADPRVSPAAASLAFVAIVAGSALVGLAGGAVWAQLAPRPVYVAVGHGQAYVVNLETTAFITADLWYCLVAAVGGLVIGALAYVLAVRRYGPVPMAAVLVGSVVAGLTARWVGQNWGLARFNDQLATARQGTLLHAPLVLGDDAPRLLWPAIVFWPLTACLLAGGLALVSALRARTPPAQPDWQAGWPAARPVPGQQAWQAGPAGPERQQGFDQGHADGAGPDGHGGVGRRADEVAESARPEHDGGAGEQGARRQ